MKVFGLLKRVIYTVAPVPKVILCFRLLQNVFSVPSPIGDKGWSCRYDVWRWADNSWTECKGYFFLGCDAFALVDRY